MGDDPGSGGQNPAPPLVLASRSSFLDTSEWRSQLGPTGTHTCPEPGPRAPRRQWPNKDTQWRWLLPLPFSHTCSEQGVEVATPSRQVPSQCRTMGGFQGQAQSPTCPPCAKVSGRQRASLGSPTIWDFPMGQALIQPLGLLPPPPHAKCFHS